MSVVESPSPTPFDTASAPADPSASLLTVTPSPAATKLKGVRFADAADILLLKSISCSSAHLAAWGKKGALFEEVHKQFLGAAPAGVLAGRDRPSQKTLEDRFKTIVSRRRKAVKENAAASGIVEVYGEKETLLDDIILEMDEKAADNREERNEKSERERKLLEAGKSIRNAALRRNGADGEALDDTVANSGAGSSRVSPSGSARDRRRQRAVYVCDSDDESNEILKKDMAHRREAQKRRLDINEKQFDLEEKRVRLDEIRFRGTQAAVSCRLDLDEKRAEVEIEERKQAMNERGKMIDVLAALASKIAKCNVLRAPQTHAPEDCGLALRCYAPRYSANVSAEQLK